jgi:hypothetical protein
VGVRDCRYNISCYSSLLQQVDATADAGVAFQQQASAQAALAPYAALWLHPDDLQHLRHLQSQQGAPGAGSSFSGMEHLRSTGAGVGGARASVLGFGVPRCATGLLKVGSRPCGCLCMMHCSSQSVF